MPSKKPSTALRRTTRATTKATPAPKDKAIELERIARKHERPNAADEESGGRGIVRGMRRTVTYLPVELFDALDDRARKSRRNLSQTMAAVLAEAFGIAL